MIPVPSDTRVNGHRVESSSVFSEEDPVPHNGHHQRAVQQFVTAQVVNAVRNLAALRPFAADEFGTDPASPSMAHLDAANTLISHLRQRLTRMVETLRYTTEQQPNTPYTSQHLALLLRNRQRTERAVKLIEKIWAFYLELFGQRQTRFGDYLLAADRIALDCYQAVYMGLGAARSIPSPAPFSYMETGFSPATFRRGISLTRLGKQSNPFPVVSLPYHRLINPWTLGAVHHEVSHNLQSDLGLWEEVPRRLQAQLQAVGLDETNAEVWARWHKETWADLCGLLLGGPALVASLMDVVARTPAVTMGFQPEGVHPTPYLRVLINLELLRRMGFTREADQYQRLWQTLYPAPQQGSIPTVLLKRFPRAGAVVVDTICFQPYPQLGGKSLAEVTCFRREYQPMVEEAARRLATATDPGIIPARFLVGAARWAFDHKLTNSSKITEHFYHALKKR